MYQGGDAPISDLKRSATMLEDAARRSRRVLGSDVALTNYIQETLGLVTRARDAAAEA